MMRGLQVLISVVLVLCLLLMGGGQVLAQDVSAEDSAPAPTPIEDGVEEMAVRLFTLIFDATYLPFAAGFVALLTALSKRAIGSVGSNVLALFWTVAMWAAYVFAQRAGYGLQFETLTQALTTLGSTVLGVTITPVIASKLYEFAAANQVAVIGYQRPPIDMACGTPAPAS